MTIAESLGPDVTEERNFVSDALHKLSQPLTALHCSLELSLARDQSPEEFRSSVEAALQNAERLRQRLLLLRELSDAGDPGDISVPVDLRRLLEDLREDLLPVFESAGGRFEVDCVPLLVRGNVAKLGRAFFYLLEYLLRHSPQASLRLTVQEANGWAEIKVMPASTSVSPASPNARSVPVMADEVEITHRTLRATGGSLMAVESASGEVFCTASLPISK